MISCSSKYLNQVRGIISSHSVLASPLSSSCFKLCSVSFVDLSDFRNQRIIRIGISKHRTDRKQDFRDCESGRPVVSQYIQTYASVAIDVGMVDPGCEVELRWFEGVIGREMDVQEENST